MGKEQSIKKRLRASSAWKKLRSKLKAERRVDEITLQPLRKGFNLHHKDLSVLHYADITDESRFSVLNKNTHEMVHWLYGYYRKDPSVITRLEALMIEMTKLNGNDKKNDNRTR